MRISAKTDYALRAVIEMADPEVPRWVKSEVVANRQAIPPQFLSAILNELRHAGVVISRRGHDGGYALARDPREISLAHVIQAIDGPLLLVAGMHPERVQYEHRSRYLADVWLHLRQAESAVLDRVTLADVVSGDVPIT